MNIEEINKAFDKFISDYDMNDERIKLKYEHTYRVAKQSLEIAKSINLDEENTKLAYLIGMLHDVGRFPQEKIYHTFNDSISKDHAELGCKVLFEDGLIRNFIKDNKYDDLIYKSIYFHNKYSIDDNEIDENIILHEKIIRDADKIDILHNVCNLGGIKLPEDDNGISMETMEDFLFETPVSHSHKHTKNDSTLVMIAFVFDLNFTYSYRYFKDNEYINKIYNKLKNKELFLPYINKANEHIERKLENVKHKIFS